MASNGFAWKSYGKLSQIDAELLETGQEETNDTYGNQGPTWSQGL